jgi:septation ring formation regulator EzrA
MTEGYINIAQVESDEELETAAVAGAAAVQRLIADRNNLRNQLAASRVAQEELRQRLATQHQRYIELAKKIVAQLHQFDSSMRDAVRGVTKDDATEMPAAMKQFDKSGSSIGQKSPSPSSNGVSHGNGALPPQPWDLDASIV